MNHHQNIQQKLLVWYKDFGRHQLPWRNTSDVYHVYISEIMLQQTQVSRVLEYFYPFFLEQYPSLKVLAEAHIDEVLTSWSGLGYYSRARNLHKTAKICDKNSLPDDMNSLLKLPGIGRYTASAICSFGYHQNVPVVDTNISRVLKRFFALVEVTEPKVWEYAQEFLNHREPRSHNLALMDLGSMICTPTNPSCLMCPLRENCLGKDEPELYTKTKKVQYENLELFYGIFFKDEKIGLKKSTTKLYQGLLELPSVDPIEENYIGSFKHSYTKYKIVVKLYTIDEIEEEGLVFLSQRELEKAPISTLTKKALNLVG